MNINQFTIKSQEAIGKAQEIAQSHQSQTVENFHLLKGMILSDDYLVPNLMKKLGVNLSRLNDALDQVINSQPRSSGSELYYSSEVSKTFNDAVRMNLRRPSCSSVRARRSTRKTPSRTTIV